MSFNKNIIAKTLTIIGFIMVLVFLVIGSALLFFPVYPYLPRNMKLVIGVFFIAYGFFRFARLIQQIREQKRKEYYDE